MKLYTEEQVNIAMRYATLTEDSYKEVLERLTPIELPSDEEIESASNDKINISNDCFGQYDFTSGQKDGFLEGAYWMKEQILNQNK